MHATLFCRDLEIPRQADFGMRAHGASNRRFRVEDMVRLLDSERSASHKTIMRRLAYDDWVTTDARRVLGTAPNKP
ncbi:MAG: hypothetical protein WBL23_18645 [Salinisphaera sp.]|uniref:hypothetical protein n=1 Tax=Salinisphaera sp. TaxID=1914330 RepID=UPI003C7E35D5